MLEIRQLCIQYGKRQILKQADLWADIGLTCIIGESGSGKSSILNALMDHVDHQCETYRVNGVDLMALSDEERKTLIRNQFAYLSQTENFVSDMSCYDNMRLYANMAGIELSASDIQRYLEMVHLDIGPKSFPDQLSGGEKQRLALAQALAKGTEVILCDEMTASLDPKLKQEIYGLLEEVAEKYAKIILVTTHDEDIYEQVRHLYRIEDGRLISVKEPERQEHEQAKKELKFSRLNGKYLWKYVSQKVDRQFSMFLLYSIMSAIVVAISAFLIFYRTQYLSLQNEIMGLLSQGEISVINQTVPIMGGESFSYSEQNAAFEDGMLDALKEIDHVEAVYPYYWASFIENPLEYDVDFENHIDITFADGSEAKNEITMDGGVSTGYFIPYYPSQQFDSKQHVVSTEAAEDGAYLSRSLFYNLGYTDADMEKFKGSTLKTTVYLPVGVYLSEATVTSAIDNVETQVTMHNPIYVGVDLEIPIAGFIENWYIEDIGGGNIYLPIEKMEEMRSSVAQTPMDMAWGCNAYRVYVDDTAYLEEVTQEIHALSSQITTGSSYMDTEARAAQQNYIVRMTLIALIAVIATGLILSYVYGIFYYQKNKRDVKYFQNNGMKKEEWRGLIGRDVVIQSLIVLILAVPILIIIFYCTWDMNLYAPIGWLSLESLGIAGCVLILTIIQTVLSRFYYYRKV